MSDNNYVLGSLANEQKRLNIQSVIFENETRKTLMMAGLKAGMRCADLGCGAGDTTFLISRLIGHEGRVDGVDINENAINTCTRRAHEDSVGNTEFHVGSIYNTGLEENEYDLVFSRFVFQHLKEPERALREMSRIAKKNGLLVIEELDHGSWLSYPEEPNLEKLRQTYVRLLESNGSDPYIARKLYNMLSKLGLKPEMGAYTVPVTTDMKPFNNLGIQLAETLEESILRKGLMTKEEFLKMFDGIRKFSNSPNGLVLYAITFRVWSRNII